MRAPPRPRPHTVGSSCASSGTQHCIFMCWVTLVVLLMLLESGPAQEVRRPRGLHRGSHRGARRPPAGCPLGCGRFFPSQPCPAAADHFICLAWQENKKSAESLARAEAEAKKALSGAAAKSAPGAGAAASAGGTTTKDPTVSPSPVAPRAPLVGAAERRGRQPSVSQLHACVSGCGLLFCARRGSRSSRLYRRPHPLLSANLRQRTPSVLVVQNA